jgi:hypothetical protein
MRPHAADFLHAGDAMQLALERLHDELAHAPGVLDEAVALDHLERRERRHRDERARRRRSCRGCPA